MYSLAELGKLWRSRLGKGATEPLSVAVEVMAVADDWMKYKADAGGLSCSTWLEKTFGKGKNLAWFSRRHDALLAIGEHARRTWHHDSAVWAIGKLSSPDEIKRLDQLVQVATKKNGGNPLTPTVVRRIAAKAKIAIHKRFSKCVRCTELEWALIEAGVPLPKHGAGPK